MTKPGDSQTKKTLHELAKEFPDKTYRELEKYRDADRQEEALGIGGIGHNNPPDLVEVMAIENEKLKKKSEQLQDELDRFKKENNDLYNKIADLTEVAQSKDYFRDPDYKYLIEENQRLEQERNELLVVNKRLNQKTEDQVEKARKAGM